MRVRSITCFCSPLDPLFDKTLSMLADLAHDCHARCHDAGWEVQTKRLATTPFWHYSKGSDAVKGIIRLEERTKAAGFDYLSVGPARLKDQQTYKIIPQILKATETVFCTAFLTHPFSGVSMTAVKACAEIIHSAARITPNGFANLRFSAMSLVQPFTPFFPAAYSYGRTPAFALAMECADAALDAFTRARDIPDGRQCLLQLLNDASRTLSAVANGISAEYGVDFKGFDFSLAPYPEDWCSIGNALENLGVSQVGYMGTLSSAVILAEALERGTWLRAGFNGLMLPVLEDSILAGRSASEHFSVKDLILVSSVCGTGLDTVPLPGDCSKEKISMLLLDIAALSLRLNKPLTARLMPIPSLNSGGMTTFDFNFFRNSRVMDFPAGRMEGPISRSKWIDIRPRGRLT